MLKFFRIAYKFAQARRPFLKVKETQSPAFNHQQNQEFIQQNTKLKLCLPFAKQLQQKILPPELITHFPDYSSYQNQISQLISNINASKDLLKSFNLDLYNYLLLLFHVNLLTSQDFSHLEKELLKAIKQQRPRQPLLIRGLKLAANFPQNKDLLPLILKRDQSSLFTYCFKVLQTQTINLFQATSILEQLEKAMVLEQLVAARQEFAINLSKICLNSITQNDSWQNIVMVARIGYYNPNVVLHTIQYKSTLDLKSVKQIAILINSLSKIVANPENALFKECIDKLVNQLRALNHDQEQDLSMIAWDLFKLDHGYYKQLLPKLKNKLMLQSHNLQNLVQFHTMCDDAELKDQIRKSYIRVKELNPSMLAIFLDGVDKFDLSTIESRQISPSNIARLVSLCGTQSLDQVLSQYIEKDQIDLRGLQIIASKAPEYKELIAKKLVEKVNLSEIDFKVSFVRQLKNASSLLLELDSKLEGREDGLKLMERLLDLYLEGGANQQVQGLGNLIYLVSKHRRESVVIPELADRLFDLDPIELLNLWKACSEEWIDDAIVEGLKKQSKEKQDRFRETLLKVKRGDKSKLAGVHEYLNL